MTIKQKEQLRILRKKNKGLRKLLRRIQYDLNYMRFHPKKINLLLLSSRIDMIRKELKARIKG